MNENREEWAQVTLGDVLTYFAGVALLIGALLLTLIHGGAACP